MKDAFICAARELKRRRGRTLANMSGYALATALVVVLVTLILASRTAERGVLAGTGTHFIGYAPICLPKDGSGSIEKSFEGFALSSVQTRLLPTLLLKKFGEIPEIKQAAPYLQYIYPGPGGRFIVLGAFDPKYMLAVATTCCAETNIIEGSFLAADDRTSVMLEEGFAKSRRLHAGDGFDVLGKTYTVAGIVNPGIKPIRPDVYMILAEASDLLSHRLSVPIRDAMTAVLVEAQSSTVHRRAMAAAMQILPNGVVSSYDCWKPASAVIVMNDKTAWLLVAIIGLAAVLIGMKTQSIAVVERRRDMAILKALGQTNRILLTQVLTESGLLSFLGGITGCLIGTILLALVPFGLYMRFPTADLIAIRPLILLVSPFLALFGGLIAGIIPALSAARQDPAEVLRRI